MADLPTLLPEPSKFPWAPTFMDPHFLHTIRDAPRRKAAVTRCGGWATTWSMKFCMGHDQ
eukprot:4157286-Pyramimonas_sp.AAC.1